METTTACHSALLIVEDAFIPNSNLNSNTNIIGFEVSMNDLLVVDVPASRRNLDNNRQYAFEVDQTPSSPLNVRAMESS